MPHFVIEHYTETPADFDRTRAMHIALEVGAACGFIVREDIKVRTMNPEDILFGDGRRSFIHVTVLLLTGRTDEMKLSLAKTLIRELRAAFPKIESISVDTRNLNPNCYKKDLT